MAVPKKFFTFIYGALEGTFLPLEGFRAQNTAQQKNVFFSSFVVCRLSLHASQGKFEQ